MKTSLTYGAAMAIAGAVLTLLLYFAGLHDSAEKMKTAQWAGSIGGIGIGIACLTLSMRERRAQCPADREWGYGSALAGGVLTGLFASLFGIATAYLYFGLINPGFSDVIFAAQVAAMQEKGMSAAQVEKIEPMLRAWMSPTAMAAMQFFMGLVWSTALSLIIAIFLRQRPAAPAAAEPPPVAG